jgi:hypothetical protein
MGIVAVIEKTTAANTYNVIGSEIETEKSLMLEGKNM